MTGRIRAGTVVVELEQRIRGVVRLELDAHRDTLAELVDAELERVVSELVAERLGATNGAPRVNAKPQEPVRAGPETSLRDETPQAAAVEELCRKCGREPRLPGRRIGSRCKGKRDHARAIARKRGKRTGAAESDAEPRPAPESDPEPAGAPDRFARTEQGSASRSRRRYTRRAPGVLARPFSSSELDAAERGAAAIAVAEVETRVDDDGREWIVRRLPDGVPDRSLTIERSSVSPRTPSGSRIA